MSSSWQTELAESFTDPQELLRFLQLDPTDFPDINLAHSVFSFKVTRSYAGRISKSNPHDPLLRQIVPLSDELYSPAEFLVDPVGDIAASVTPGLLQKYQRRVLMVMTGACAIHCRYCFRRNFPYSENIISKSREEEALTAISTDSDIHEVILSGGDPWVLSDEQLANRINALASIPHVQRLRIHTRMPVILPSRITPALLSILESTRLKVVVVIHANHPQELDHDVEQALNRLRIARCHLLNQAVLLKGINDTVEIQTTLSEKLFSMGVMPYYLHLLDKAKGTSHFEVTQAYAQNLMIEVRRLLPGYLVPRLVREDSGYPYKTPLD